MYLTWKQFRQPTISIERKGAQSCVAHFFFASQSHASLSVEIPLGADLAKAQLEQDYIGAQYISMQK